MPRVFPVPADSQRPEAGGQRTEDGRLRTDGARQRGDGQPKAGPGAASVKPGWPAAGAHLGDAGHKPEDSGRGTEDREQRAEAGGQRPAGGGRKTEDGTSAGDPSAAWSGAADQPATSNDQPSTPSNGALSPFESECTAFFTDIVQVLGVPKSVGQIYGLLFASPQPLGFTDIVEKLAISKGSASQGLQLLRTLGAVQSVESNSSTTPAAGSRRELFVPELGLRRLVGGVLREKIEPLVGEGANRIHRLETAAAVGTDAPTRKFSGNRVKQIQTWRRQMGLLLPLLKTLLASRK